MNWLAKKKNLSVLFTEDSADQTLLDAVEKEINGHAYQTFSNLCKQALWQFLFLSSDASQPATTSGGMPNYGPQLQKLEQRMMELHSKLLDFEQQVSPKIPAQDFSQLQRLEQSLAQMNQQLNQLQHSINHIQVVSPSDQSALPVTPAPSLSESGEVEHSQSPSGAGTSEPPAEADPVLSRISRLIEDF